MPVTPSSTCLSAGTDTSGVKKKYNSDPSLVIKGESSAPAVFTGPGSGTGGENSVVWISGGYVSFAGVILTDANGILLSRFGGITDSLSCSCMHPVIRKT